MQITYEEYQRQTGSRSRRRPGSRKKQPLAQRELRRLGQLGVSLALFLAVFLGRGIFPDQTARLGEQLRQDMDFSAAFSALGQAVSEGTSVSEAVGDWCVAVFAGTGLEVSSAPPDSWADRAVQTLEPVAPERRAAELGLTPQTAPVFYTFPIEHRTVLLDPPAEPEPEPEPVPEKEPYTGPALPENTTMDYVPLWLDETVTPVMGVLSSGFGYREHPLTGGEKFHYGVDLAVGKGTEIKAFADGVVDFIGQSDAYGNYMQLRHANGVTSFYAHCSELLLPKGTQVSAGDVIALSGDTGDVTGPHLHFELKVDDVRLNPEDHIDVQS